jgi:hypothetical protein
MGGESGFSRVFNLKSVLVSFNKQGAVQPTEASYQQYQDGRTVTALSQKL